MRYRVPRLQTHIQRTPQNAKQQGKRRLSERSLQLCEREIQATTNVSYQIQKNHVWLKLGRPHERKSKCIGNTYAFLRSTILRWVQMSRILCWYKEILKRGHASKSIAPFSAFCRGVLDQSPIRRYLSFRKWDTPLLCLCFRLLAVLNKSHLPLLFAEQSSLSENPSDSMEFATIAPAVDEVTAEPVVRLSGATSYAVLSAASLIINVLLASIILRVKKGTHSS